MVFQVLFFGELCEIVGESKISMSDIKNLSSLKEELLQRWPLLGDRVYSFAVNKMIVNDKMAKRN